jgi:asparagine synthase (glutamine-hydrolysing)
MCGIAGMVRLDGGPVSQPSLFAQTLSLAHRGPDGEAHWISPNGTVGLGHRRLAIIDLSAAAAQPMRYLDRFSVTYNGEIYNYLELRDELIGRGHAFRTLSDTEVILAAYAEFGTDCLSRFDGMFAFALWDEERRSLFCARDRFGEKPFYFHYQPGRLFLFASEIKGLFAAGADSSFNRRSVFDYLAHDVVQNPFHPGETFYQGVHSLEPAHWLLLTQQEEQLVTRRYWQLARPVERTNVSIAEAADRLRELLNMSVHRRLRSDVSVGSSLSGGLDSSTIVCIMQKLRNSQGGTPHRTFSARFSAPELDEGRFIDAVVRATGAQPYSVWPSVEGLARDLDKIVYHQEEPFGGASVYAQWEVMRLAQAHETKVLLDGQGADETMAGYLHFFQPHLKALFTRDRQAFGDELQALVQRHGARFPTGWLFRAEAMMPQAVDALRRFRRSLCGPRLPSWLSQEFVRPFKSEDPPFRVFGSLDEALRFFTEGYGLRNLLRYADRNSMAFGREVRLPFLSHELVEFLFTLPDDYKLSGGWTKKILREATVDILPEVIRLRPDKIGFATPEDAWLASPSMSERLPEAAELLRKEGLLAPTPLPREAQWRTLMVATLFRVPLGSPSPA